MRDVEDGSSRTLLAVRSSMLTSGNSSGLEGSHRNRILHHISIGELAAGIVLVLQVKWMEEEGELGVVYNEGDTPRMAARPIKVD